MEIFIKNSLIKFLIVGIVNTVIGTGVMLFLFNIVDISYWYSTFFGNVAGALNSYFLNRSYTFKSTASFQQSALKFICVIIFSYFIAYFSSPYISVFIISFSSNFPAWLAGNLPILLGTIMYTFINYFGQKKFVFNK
ncbi:GtrA family protein [Paenibacillus mucilaginosus]|uniref:GtrA/DPMS transmembrane domain-containing protein n=1 Tax=Paenibacillus mucilaginosus (strain KNP414) TaxID=1036673 RepID=F8FQH8_PAEMK|nr:GtrA family protein [Paenibacillus mucilaginosus]AEI39239.1 hypothetical protein KNP414_00635 [Paenibacillus mucilaginosus KNP414]MCG7217120.1 GtrA family protein [Paenibacillus mucilaginosus]WDM28246.1 GtrA family protein [Paenibacillus mucilaginosus]